MATGFYDVPKNFERLEISKPAKGEGNLTIKTPDNVTLVLNFGAYPPVISSTNGEKSAESPSSPSQSEDVSSQSTSDSPSSSNPSSPEMGRAVAKLPTTFSAERKREKSEGRSSVPKRVESFARKKAPPTRETLEKFMSQQGQVHTTVSLSEVDYSNVYKEDWAKKKHYLSFTKHHRIRDVKFDGRCNVYLASRQSVQLYDANGHFLERLYRDKISEPWGLHVHDSGNVFVSDHQNDCVVEFNHIGIQVKRYGPVPSPTGVTVSSSGFVFICSQSGGCVYVFDKYAKQVAKLGEGTLTSPAYIVLHDKLVLVSDEARIIGFTLDNAIAFVYGHADKSNHPASICVDRKTGFALATDYYKSSIIAVKKDMKRALMVKDTVRPILCAISPYGHLIVGERLSKGVQFKMYRGE